MDMESARKWFTEHKLRAVGTLWATSLIGSFAYNFSQPGMKTSVKLIHARLHAQALTLAALAGSALVEAYDHQTGDKAKRLPVVVRSTREHVPTLSMYSSVTE